MSDTRTRRHEGYYFVVVDGVPQYCQWQELKDYLRDFAKVRPGHTNVIKVNEDGTRVGFCPLPNKAEAYRAFDYLVAEGWQGLDIRVSVIWKVDLSSQDIQRKRGPEASRRRRLPLNIPPSTVFHSNGIHPMRSPAAPVSYSFSGMSQALPTVPIGMNTEQPQSPCHRTIIQEPSITQIRPSQGRTTYSYTSIQPVQANRSLATSFPSSRPVTALNTEGNIYKDRQSIHISKLRHDIKTPQLKQLLSRYGQVSDVVIKRGKEKRCSATAKYRKATEALLAIQGLNGKTIDGLELVVRHDRSENGSVCSAPSTTYKSSDSDSTTSSWEAVRSPRHAHGQGGTALKRTQGRAGPLVVDGARGPSHYRRHGHGDDDDSESAADLSSEDDSGAQAPSRNAFRKQASSRPRHQ